MRDLFLLASEVQSFCRDRGWQFCFIGGLALQRWGEPRLTGDIDLTILTGFGHETAYINELCDTYAGRIADAAEFAQRHRVLLLQSEHGVPVDISLGALPFEERVVERASSYRFLADVRLLTCSAEDLVVLKAFADRPRDWADIEGVLTAAALRGEGSAPYPAPTDRPAHLVLRPNRGVNMRTPRHRVGGSGELGA